MGLRVKKGYGFFEHYRRHITTIVLLLAAIIILLTAPSWKEGGNIERAFGVAGVLLILAGIFGRLWSTMYIGGKKNASLVTKGPYSLCRNPLYLFSFLAGLGACLEFENLLLVALFIGFFWIYYYKVITSEEKRLQSFFGDDFKAYMATTPMFVPNIFRYDGGDGPNIIPKLLWKNFLDASIFFAFIPLAYLVHRLQESGVLVAYLRIP